MESSRYIDRVKLGEGTYGEVYRAVDSETHQNVALKIMKSNQEDEGISPFSFREVSTLRSISHPNIISLLDVIAKPKTLMLVFEYVPVDLMKYLHFQAMHMDLLRSYAFQLIAGVYYLHTHQIIHRDIKPANLLLNKDGMLKICDFGLARNFSVPMRQYSPGVVTLWYRAPELLFEPKCYDISIDIWSVGCVIAEMVLRRPLFKGDSDIDLIHKIFSILGTPDDLSVLKYFSTLDIPVYPPKNLMEVLNTDDEYLCDLISKMLRFNPANRISALEALRHPFFDGIQEQIRRISLPPELL